MVDSRWRLLLPPAVRAFPADLTAVVLLVAATAGAVFLPFVSQTPLRLVLGFPFALFVPGYALVAALFPRGGELGAPGDGAEPASESRAARPMDDGLGGLERVAFSVGTSIVLVTLIGLTLNFTPWGVRPVPVVAALGGLTLALVGVAARRRRRLPEEERLRVPYRGWLDAARRGLVSPETYADGALNVLLIVSLVLAVASVGYAIGAPGTGETFTEFYLLHENEDGELVAEGYPTNFTAGESQSLHVGIHNHERRSVEYTVVVELQQVRMADGTAVVESERQLHRFRARVSANETWRRNHSVTPRTTGDHLRLAYLLYRSDPPDDPTVGNAYRETHLWINVSRPG